MNIPGYAFVNTNSKTQAGGVGLYLSNDLKFSRRSDLDISDDGIESCWIELARTAQKNVVNKGTRGVGPWGLQRESIEI